MLQPATQSTKLLTALTVTTPEQKIKLQTKLQFLNKRNDN
jgi:hypothetical protein